MSHYYFDRDTIPYIRDYHTLGTVLPDLLKNADKTIILHPEKLHHTDPAICEIIAGWKKHLEVDRYFHSSDFFVTRASELRILLTPAVAGSPVKPFFLGHIALELILDNLLITTGKISVDDFYSHLAGCNQDKIKEFLNFAGLSDTDRFFRFFEKFKSNRYLETYAETPQISYALKRVCMRIWDAPFTPEHEEKMTKVLAAYRDNMYPGFMTIFDEIAVKL
ncbi:MAG TPA: hypothetical protein VFE54_09005 [Mucilaginibacter sp.]|nr:hypothetical protein [Mucilaginibacter sp.]